MDWKIFYSEVNVNCSAAQVSRWWLWTRVDLSSSSGRQPIYKDRTMSSFPRRSNPTREGRGSNLLDGRGGTNTVDASSFKESNISNWSLKMLRQILPRRLAIVRFSIRGLPSGCLNCMDEQYTIAYTRKRVRSGRSTPFTLTMNSSDALFRDSLRRRILRHQLRIIYARSKVSMQEPAPLSSNPS